MLNMQRDVAGACDIRMGLEALKTVGDMKMNLVIFGSNTNLLFRC